MGPMLMADTTSSTGTATISGFVSLTSCAMQAQLSHLCADGEVSCTKRPRRWASAALKICTTSGTGGDSVFGVGLGWTASTGVNRKNQSASAVHDGKVDVGRWHADPV